VIKRVLADGQRIAEVASGVGIEPKVYLATNQMALGLSDLVVVEGDFHCGGKAIRSILPAGVTDSTVYEARAVWRGLVAVAGHLLLRNGHHADS